jgi:hypothetical protein
MPSFSMSSGKGAFISVFVMVAIGFAIAIIDK